MSEAHKHLVKGGPVVLDIGGDLGALVIYTTSELAGREIEISRADGDEHPIHTEVHPRSVNGGEVFAGVFAQLREGRYRFLDGVRAAHPAVTIRGGSITELDWR